MPTNTAFQSELRESFKLLFSARFGTFWFASFLSSIGTWAQQVAEPWLLLSLGASPFIIGLDSFAMNAPVWLLTLLGGVLADTRDRRRIITIFQSIQMLCPLAITLLLLFHFTINPYLIVGLSIVVGVTDALSMPSFQSIVPSLVSHDQIARGLALNSTQFNLSRIVGPALAGVLISSVGAFACFAISTASYIPFIGVALWALPKPKPALHAKSKPSEHHLVRDLIQIARVPQLRSALLTVLATSILCGPLVTFCPVLVKDVFSGEASQFSFAIGAFGIGGLLGGLALLGISNSKERRPLSFFFALAYGLILIAVALAPQFWIVPILMGLGGLAMAISNISSNTLIQSKADPKLLGQAASLFMLAMRGGLPLGSLLTGISIEYFGVQHALMANGILAVAIQFLIAIFVSDPKPKARPMNSQS